MPEEHVTGIDRELATLLSLEPSGRLAAGVRARVAKAPASRAWMAWAAAAAALVIAGGAATVMWVARGTDVPAVARPLSSTVHPPVVLTANTPMRPEPPRSRPAPREDARRHADEIEIIIDPALDLAVRRLLRAASRQPADGAVVVPEAAPPADLAVVPMAVEDLPIPVIKVTETRSLSK